jgi:hypothetical protein
MTVQIEILIGKGRSLLFYVSPEGIVFAGDGSSEAGDQGF